jgi:hypothetical protein
MSNVDMNLAFLDIPGVEQPIEPTTTTTTPVDVTQVQLPEEVDVPAATETEAERIARLDREQAQRQFEAMQAAEAATAQQQRVDAFAQLQTLLNRYGLGKLEANVRDAIARGITDGDAILFQLRDTEDFKTRFAGNAARAKKGLPELDPATYIGMEEQYREILRRNLGPEMFSVYDEPTDFQKLIEGDVSAAELQDRVNRGYKLVADADPEVKRQMQRLYDIGERELVGYFLDPAKGAPVLTRQAQAAQVAARASEQAGFQLGVTTAEDLIARGYSEEQARQAFEQVGMLSGLYQEMGGEQMLTQEQKVGAAFGFNVEAQQALERRKAQRIAEFQTGGQFARTTGATSGTVETGAGTAQ